MLTCDPLYTCSLCGGPLSSAIVRDRRRTRDRPGFTFNQTRHEWLNHFRLLGWFKDKDIFESQKKFVMEYFVSGQGIPEAGSSKHCPCKPGIDAAWTKLCKQYTQVPVYDWNVYDLSTPNKWVLQGPIDCVPIHDSCLVLFAKALENIKDEHGKQQQRKLPCLGPSCETGIDEETEKNPSLDISSLLWTLVRNHLRLGLGMQPPSYLELSCVNFSFDMSYDTKQGGEVPIQLHPHTLDPLVIPEFESESLAGSWLRPSFSQALWRNNRLSTLPLEVLYLILDEFSLQEQAKLVQDGSIPASTVISWRARLKRDMPWVFCFRGPDWDDININWLGMYAASLVDSISKPSTAPRRRDLSLLDNSEPMPDLQDAEDLTQENAKDVYSLLLGVSVSSGDITQDLTTRNDIPVRDDCYRAARPVSGSVMSNGSGPSGLKSFEPMIFPGLSNRRRIWALSRFRSRKYLEHELHGRSTWCSSHGSFEFLYEEDQALKAARDQVEPDMRAIYSARSG